MFLNIYDKTMSKDFSNAWMKVHVTPWKTYEDWNTLYKNDPDFMEAENVNQFFFEGLGTLVKEGLLPIRMVALLMCGMTRYHWERHAPIVDEGRRAIGHRRWFSEEEYLYGELIRYLGEHPELDTRVENPVWVKEPQ